MKTRTAIIILIITALLAGLFLWYLITVMRSAKDEITAPAYQANEAGDYADFKERYYSMTEEERLEELSKEMEKTEAKNADFLERYNSLPEEERLDEISGEMEKAEVENADFLERYNSLTKEERLKELSEKMQQNSGD